MLQRVYVETTVISYLTARPSRDVVIAGHQQSTRDWWERDRADYELCVSELVLREASAGDQEAARERMEVLSNMTILVTDRQALELAQALVKAGALPEKAFEDALHIAIAAQQRISYLLTWNLKHIANASMRPVIESVCTGLGYRTPIICTPEELRGERQ